MPFRMSCTAGRLAAVGLTALAVSLTAAAPALALDAPLPQLETVTSPLSAADDPEPEPSPSPTPLLPLPEPVAEIVNPVLDPLVEQLTGGSGEQEPVAGQGSQPEQAAAPAPAAAPARAAQAASSGVSTSQGTRSPSAVGALPARAGAPQLGTPGPLLAAAPSFVLPGLPQPQAAPLPTTATDVLATPRPGGAPAGLPALVVAVAAAAVAGAAAAHVAELRRRRPAALRA